MDLDSTGKGRIKVWLVEHEKDAKNSAIFLATLDTKKHIFYDVKNCELWGKRKKNEFH